MKMLFIILLGFSASVMASEKITLRNDANLLVQDRDGIYQLSNQILEAGIKLKISDTAIQTRYYGVAYRVKKFRSDPESRNESIIKEDIKSKYKTYYVTETSFRSSAPVYADNSSYGADYEACYESPRNRWKKKKKKNRGKNKIALGIFGAIAGQVIGGDTGDAITVASSALAVYGLIEIDYAGTKYDGKDCLDYFNRGNTQNWVVDGESCTTTRFYTTRWGQQDEVHEFFETSCGHDSKTYVSYERDSKFWR